VNSKRLEARIQERVDKKSKDIIQMKRDGKTLNQMKSSISSLHNDVIMLSSVQCEQQEKLRSGK